MLTKNYFLLERPKPNAKNLGRWTSQKGIRVQPYITDIVEDATYSNIIEKALRHVSMHIAHINFFKHPSNSSRSTASSLGRMSKEI